MEQGNVSVFCFRFTLVTCLVVMAATFVLDNSFSYVIDKTWDGKPLKHHKARVSLQRGADDTIMMHVRAPFYNDPPAPAGAPGQPFPGLWDYEVVEAFFLSDSEKYLEVELCPHGQHLLLLLDGRRNAFKQQLPIRFDYQHSGNEWSGTAYLPLDYFPPNVTKFNAYAIHGEGDKRTYEAYKPVPGPQPDFHRLEDFASINFADLDPENSSPSYNSSYWTT